VTFGRDEYDPSPGHGSYPDAPNVAPNRTKNMDPNMDPNMTPNLNPNRDFKKDLNTMQTGLTEEFVLSIERELLTTLMPLLVFLKEMTPSPGHGSNGDTSICVGSRVFYYSRAYELAAHSLQLLEGMVVSCEGQGKDQGREHFEVVLANGAREFEVSPDDVVYSCPPLIG
jgi:hypothetical protein